jgi:predicted Na+-dependent transporter
MKKFFKDNLLLISIFGGVILAWIFPGTGRMLKGWGLSSPLIVIIFLCQGFSLDASRLKSGGGLLKAFLGGLLVSQVLGPLAGVGLGNLLPLSEPDQVGFIMMCCMAPTLVSGAVMAVKAGGESATALLLSVSLNLLGVLTIPLNLRWSLGAVVELDAAGLLFKLVFMVLVPALAGYWLRTRLPRLASAAEPSAKYVVILVFGLVMFVSTAAQTDQLRTLRWEQFLLLAAAAALAHGMLFSAAFVMARCLLGLAEDVSRSLTVVTSQKTLPIAIAVWTLAFAGSHPLAILAPLVFHPTQIIIDGIIVSRWGKRPVQA